MFPFEVEPSTAEAPNKRLFDFQTRQFHFNCYLKIF